MLAAMFEQSLLGGRCSGLLYLTLDGYISLLQVLHGPASVACPRESQSCSDSAYWILSTYWVFVCEIAPNECQALEEVGDVEVAAQDTLSMEYGRAGRRWIVSFTTLGHPAHVGTIQVTHKKLFSSETP